MVKEKTKLADHPVSVRVKLAALWVAVMCCYIYGDIFSLFLPSRLQNLLNGQSGVGATTPTALLSFAVLMSIPALTIYFTVALKAAFSRWLNIAAGTFFTGIMILIGISTVSESMMFYTYLAAVEVLLTSLIVIHAWRWPRESGNRLERAK